MALDVVPSPGALLPPVDALLPWAVVLGVGACEDMAVPHFLRRYEPVQVRRSRVALTRSQPPSVGLPCGRSHV